MSSVPEYLAFLPFPGGMASLPVNSGPAEVPGINGHIHTPHSFSAFSGMEQPFQMAEKEGISVLGINDFYTTGGYDEFAAMAVKYHVFPLFNIEFMALQKEEQAAGIRINDPVNPGRTYLSGKGLRYPVMLNERNREVLSLLHTESNRQTYAMTGKLNEYLSAIGAGLQFDPAEIQIRLAKNLLRERHIAAAIRIAVYEKFENQAGIRDFFTLLYGGKEPKASTDNIAAVENEIRNNLLKSGGPAYVPEDEKAFLSLVEVTGLITDAGGIPCYPVLLDDAKGNFTGFEKNWDLMAEQLLTKGIYMIELIPGRNDHDVLSRFVHFFDEHGFVITFGSEHNTPQLDPLTISCRGMVPPGRDLEQINYKGAAVIAAHQYLNAHGMAGFPVGCFPSHKEVHELEMIGKKVISAFTKR